MLPWPSGGTTFLIAMLAMWSTLPRSVGGFKYDSNREAALHLLVEFLAVCALGAFVFVIFVDDQVARLWPASPTGVRPAWVEVGADGVARLSDLKRAVDEAGMAVDPSWRDIVAGETKMPLLAFMQHSCRQCKRTCAVWKQLLWAIGDRLEHQLFKILRGELDSVRAAAEKWKTDNPYQLQRQLASYMAAAADMWSERTMYISLSTDKSRVHGLALQNCVWNTAWWGPPQAAIVGRDAWGVVGPGRVRIAQILPGRYAHPGGTRTPWLARSWPTPRCRGQNGRILGRGIGITFVGVLAVLGYIRIPRGPSAEPFLRMFCILSSGRVPGHNVLARRRHPAL